MERIADRGKLDLGQALAGASSEWRNLATNMARRAEVDAREFEPPNSRSWPHPIVRGLDYTETDPDLVLLRLHAARGQIKPAVLRQMRSCDLEYLAGMTTPDPVESAKSDLHRLYELKIAENAIRATRELERRAQRSAALVGVGVGALLTLASAGVVAALAALVAVIR